MSKLPYVFQTIKDEHDNASPESKRVSLYGWDTINSQKTRVAVNSDGSFIDPVPTTGNNPSDTITEAIVGAVTTTTIQRVIGATTYTKTIVEDSSTGITTVSAWS